MRESLPLWNDAEVDTASERPIGGGTGNQANRNGTELRESLPLWNDAEVDTASEWHLGCPLRRHTFLLLRKVNPKGGKTVHLCNRAMPGTPPQALWQWSRQHAAAKVHPKGGKTVHLCFWAMSGITAKGPVAMVETARRCKGVPQRRENGSPLQPGNAGNADTGPVAMIRAARRCKGVP